MKHQQKEGVKGKPKLAVTKCNQIVPKVDTTMWSSEVECPECKGVTRPG